MQRMCQDCRKPYSPKTLPGGMLPRNYKTCPNCGSQNTSVTAGTMSGAPKLKKSGPPPSSDGFGFNRKKPPTH